MKITITDTRTGRKAILTDPHALKIEVSVAEGGETLHGIEVLLTGGTLTICGKNHGLYLEGEAFPAVVLTAEATTGLEISGGNG